MSPNAETVLRIHFNNPDQVQYAHAEAKLIDPKLTRKDIDNAYQELLELGYVTRSEYPKEASAAAGGDVSPAYRITQKGKDVMSTPLNVELPCAHPNIAKEEIVRSDTEDYVCIDCGQTFTSQQEWQEIRDKLLYKK